MYCGDLMHILPTLLTLSHSSWLPRLSPSNGGWDTTKPHRRSRSVVGATTRHLRTWTRDHTNGVFNPNLKFRLCARRSVKLVKCPMRVQLRSKSHSPVLIFQINCVCGSCNIEFIWNNVLKRMEFLDPVNYYICFSHPTAQGHIQKLLQIAYVNYSLALSPVVREPRRWMRESPQKLYLKALFSQLGQRPS